MNNDKRRRKQAGGIWYVDLEKTPKNQLDRAYNKWGSTKGCGWRTYAGKHNKEKTKELDWACITLRLTPEDSFGGLNEGEEGSRKTENNDVGLNENKDRG